MKAVGYIRVSTGDQADKGASLEWQKGEIAKACAARGWELADIAGDTQTAKRSRRRPGFERCLERLDAGDYGALVVARLDRAWRSLGHFAETLDRSEKHGWQLVLLDPAVDTQTPFGRAMAGVAAVFAELERALIAQRTREGIGEKKRQGVYKGGRLLPQAQPVPEPVQARIIELAGEGLSLREVAGRLEQEGWPTVRGGPWRHSTVAQVLQRCAAAAH